LDGLYFFLFLALASIYFGGVFEGVVPLAGDAGLQNYPLRAFYSAEIKALRFPIWNPYEFAGLPYAGAMQTGAFYPLNILLYGTLHPAYAFNASLILHFAMSGFFTFLYLRLMGLGRAPSVFGGTAFAFSGFLAGYHPHTAIVNAGVWLPLAVYFLELLKRAPSLRRMALLSLPVGVQILAGNFQMCMYTYMTLAVYAAFSMFELKGRGRVGFAALGIGGIVLGMLMALPQILSSLELSALSIRPVATRTLGYIFFGEFHLYLKTLPSLIFPYLYADGAYGAAFRGGRHPLWKAPIPCAGL